MSKLDKMIKELCPEAVEYVKLGEIMTIVRGASPRPIKNYMSTPQQGVHWIKIGDVSPYDKYITNTNEYISKEGAQKSRLLKAGDFILSNSMSFGRPYILKISGCIHDGWIAMSDFEGCVVPDFLYEVLRSNSIQNYWKMSANNGGAMTNLNTDIVRSTLIPIPPLSIQQKIVSVLDTFTTLIDKMKKEVEKRKKQMEYYREKLLTFGDGDCEWKTLPDICTNCDKQRKPITSSKRVKGIYPYYGASGIVDYVESYIYDGEYLLISEDGANLVARSTPIAFSIKGKNWVNNHAHVLKFNNYNTQRLVEIYLNSIDLTFWISGGAQPKLNQENLNKIMIPVPSLDKQREIVSTLDKFESYITKLEKMIVLRQKQYEYYREQLLTFE